MMVFNNRVIWITGASSGYGKALAQAFAAVGAKLILSARRQEPLEQLAQTLPQAKVVVLDLLDENSFPDKVTQAMACFGAIDCIIHNGGIAQNASALTTQPNVARTIMDVDYFSYTELTRALLPHFIAQQKGHIVVVSGLLAKLTLPNRSSYAAAKAALFGYFGCLRVELHPHNIDVTILIPGALQTDLTTKALTAQGQPQNTQATLTGCPLDIAAQQSLEAISRGAYERYIGLKDETYTLWQLSNAYPELGIELLLSKFN